MSCSMFISLEGNVLRVVMMMTRFLYGFDCYELVSSCPWSYLQAPETFALGGG
jgi:hypothetical protein